MFNIVVLDRKTKLRTNELKLVGGRTLVSLGTTLLISWPFPVTPQFSSLYLSTCRRSLGKTLYSLLPSAPSSPDPLQNSEAL